MPISHGMAFSAKYSHRNDLRQPARLPPAASSKRPQRAALHLLRRRLPPARSTSVGAMSWQITRSRSPRAGLEPGGIAHEERRAYALLVGEAALGPEPVLAEEIAVVAQEQDEGVVELRRSASSASNSSPMPSSTEAIMAARSRISSSVPAWMPSSTLREASLTAQLERLRPGRLVLHHLRRRQHVGPAREMRALVEIGVARRRR